jgi:hypothetical protein
MPTKVQFPSQTCCKCSIIRAAGSTLNVNLIYRLTWLVLNIIYGSAMAKVHTYVSLLWETTPSACLRFSDFVSLENNNFLYLELTVAVCPIHWFAGSISRRLIGKKRAESQVRRTDVVILFSFSRFLSHIRHVQVAEVDWILIEKETDGRCISASRNSDLPKTKNRRCTYAQSQLSHFVYRMRL